MLHSLLTKLREGAGTIWYEQEENCLLCGHQSSEAICDDCRLEYFQPEVKRCLPCGKLLGGQGTLCRDCEEGKGPRGLSKVTSLGHYEGAWKEFIQKVKYKGQPYLLLSVAKVLTSWAIFQLPPPDLIVPVPMYPQKLAQRGFNQAEVLASILSRNLGIPLQEVLERTKDTVPQTTLGRRARIQNLQGVMTGKTGIELNSQVIWLVDDVVTTGTTLGECAVILQKNGAREVYGFCLGAGKEE